MTKEVFGVQGTGPKRDRFLTRSVKANGLEACYIRPLMYRGYNELGVNPLSAFRIYFIEPISQVWQLHELAIKAAPLILIAVGLSVCFKANIWNIGAEGQFILGAIVGSIIPVWRRSPSASRRS